MAWRGASSFSLFKLNPSPPPPPIYPFVSKKKELGRSSRNAKPPNFLNFVWPWSWCLVLLACFGTCKKVKRVAHISSSETRVGEEYMENRLTAMPWPQRLSVVSKMIDDFTSSIMDLL